MVINKLIEELIMESHKAQNNKNNTKEKKVKRTNFKTYH
jgi:hypothetical protein